MIKKLELTLDELDLIRQWFNALQDLDDGYLEIDDFELARKIHDHIGIRTPNSIKKFQTHNLKE